MDAPVWLQFLVGLAPWIKLVILAAVVGLSFFLGHALARRWRSEDHAMRVSLIIGSTALAAAVCLLLWPPKLGIDLSGGVILVYEIDEEATQRQQEEQQGLVRPVTSSDIVPYILMRINPSGLEDVVVRPYGDDQVEVIVPHVEAAEIDRIKEIISTAGFLEFRIVANPQDHGYLIEAAADEPSRSRLVKDGEGRTIGMWADLGVLPEDGPQGNKGDYRMSPLSTIFRNGETGEVMTDEQGNLRPEFLPADSNERNELYERFGSERTGLSAQREYFENQLGIKNLQVLMAADDGYNVRGDDVESVSAGFDESGFPSINFTMTGDGAVKFQGLTGENTPDPQTGFKRRLGILMDNALISAPELRSMISRNGQITGRFTPEEVNDLVQIIRGGSLPAALTPEPTSESQISPLLGGLTIRQSMLAMTISLLITLAVMLYYYRFAGIIACYALLANLLMTLAVMILLKASFTLPGIAGLILSVGMSVDANILIFERIREELARGSKMRMALRNGFSRATTTIIDSNVTTLIAGLVLYAIGTDVIRGFAVTLCLGLVISMFTAVYCARGIFEIGERMHWFRDLYMVQWVRETNVNFLGGRKVAVAASVALIVVGLIGAGARGRDMLDIDMAGGSSVDVLLTAPLTENQLREKLEEEQFLATYHEVVAEEKKTLNPSNRDDAEKIAVLDEELQTTDFDMTILGLPGYTDAAGSLLATGQAWKVQTSLPSVEHLEETLKRIFQRDGEARLIMRQVKYSPPQAVTNDAKEKVDDAPTKKDDDAPATNPPTSKKTETPAPSTPGADEAAAPKTPAPATPKAPEKKAPGEEAANDPRAAEPRPPLAPEAEEGANGAWLDRIGPQVLAMAGLGHDLLLTQVEAPAEQPAVDQEPVEEESAKEEPAENPKAETQEATPATTETPAAKQPAARGRSRSDLTFLYRISDDALRFHIFDAARKAGIDLDAERIEVERKDDLGLEWAAVVPLPPAQAESVFQQLQTDFANTPVFPSASKIGSKVAANMQQTAVWAMVLSFFGIVVYLWIRFQRMAYGLAAVIATLHDIFVTLAILALTHWLAPFLGFLLIENFKVSLTVIAAFLTLIGYSINDKIVIFDRIRELRGKSPHISLALVNKAVNQTLGRTILTGGTVIVSLLVLYIFGGQGIRGFSFTLLVGILVGTYSSIYIGAPVLLWLVEGAAKERETAPVTENDRVSARP